MSRKEELEGAIRVLRGELGAIEDAEHEAHKLALVGKCFKYRNCYSCPEKPSDYWWVYRIVLAPNSVLDFQIDKDGKLTVEPNGYYYPTMTGWKEITRAELNTAWAGVVGRISTLTPSRARR